MTKPGAYAFFALALGCSWPAMAEEPSSKDSEHSSYPIVIGLIQEAMQLPFKADVFKGPLHPGALVGTEHHYWRGRRGELFQTANLGYFHHANVDRVLFLNTAFAFGYGWDFGLALEHLLGVGYGHTFIDRQIYSTETGEAMRDRGKPTLIASFALGLRYDLRAADLLPASLFLRYEPVFQFNFIPTSVLPVTPRALLTVGTKIHLPSREP